MANQAPPSLTTYFIDSFRTEPEDYIPIQPRNELKSINSASSIRLSLPPSSGSSFVYSHVGLQRLVLAAQVNDVDSRHWKSATEPFHFTIDEDALGTAGDLRKNGLSCAFHPFRLDSSSDYRNSVASACSFAAQFGPKAPPDTVAPEFYPTRYRKFGTFINESGWPLLSGTSVLTDPVLREKSLPFGDLPDHFRDAMADCKALLDSQPYFAKVNAPFAAGNQWYRGNDDEIAPQGELGFAVSNDGKTSEETTPPTDRVPTANQVIALPNHELRSMPAHIESQFFRYRFRIHPRTHKFSITAMRVGDADEVVSTLPAIDSPKRFVNFTFHNRRLAALLGLDVGTDPSVQSFTVSLLPRAVDTDYKFESYWEAPFPVNPFPHRLLYLHVDGENMSYRANMHAFDNSIHQVFYNPDGPNDTCKPYVWESTQPVAFYPLRNTADHIHFQWLDADGNQVNLNGGHWSAQCLMKKVPRF